MRIILDNNIWISFLIGKRLTALQTIFGNPHVRVVFCDELEREFLDVACRPKIRKYVDELQIDRVHRLMTQYCEHIFVTGQSAIYNRDPKDVYLLALAETVGADYLVSGDSDLTDLGSFHHTRIVTFQQLLDLLDK